MKYFLSALFVFLVLAAVGVYLFSQKPATGVIKPAGESSQASENLIEVPNSFAGKYVSLMYGSGYGQKSHEVFEKEGAVILEAAFFSQPTGQSKKIALTVRSLPGGNLEDVPDFKMRQLKPEIYKKENFLIGDISGVSFLPADDGQFEKTFFVKQGDLLAIMALTAAALPDKSLNDEADAIVKSLEWAN